MNTPMRGPSPEASGEAIGPEGDDSNMGTVPTSGPEATSSQGKFTPGPWHLGGTFMPDSKDPRQCVWSSTPFGQQSGEIICKDVTPANARLIAAAPDLLAALRDLVEHPYDGEGRNLAALDRARAAIAKVQP